MNISAANSGTVKDLICEGIEAGHFGRRCINGRFIKPFDHLDGAIADDRGPVVQPADDKLNRFCMAVMES